MEHKLEITTPYGDRYIIHENGDIERTDIEGFKPSGDWKMRGIRSLRCSTLLIPLEDIPAWLERKPPILFKNGHPRWTVADIDHGTYREWGNTRSHGIQSIRVLAVSNA